MGGCPLGGSALLAFYEGNPPVIDGFPSQRPVTRGFDVFFYLCLNKRFSKQSNDLRRHCAYYDVTVLFWPVFVRPFKVPPDTDRLFTLFGISGGLRLFVIDSLCVELLWGNIKVALFQNCIFLSFHNTRHGICS